MSWLIGAFYACSHCTGAASLPPRGTERLHRCRQCLSRHYHNFEAPCLHGFSSGSILKSSCSTGEFLSLVFIHPLKDLPNKTWRNEEFRKSNSPNQWDLGASLSPEKPPSGYRYFCKIIAGGPLVPLNHTICKCIKNTQKETVLNTLTARLPAGLVHVNTAQFNTIFRKTMQQKTSSKQSPPECFQARSTTELFSKRVHLYRYRPSYYPAACYGLVSNGTLLRS